MKAIVWVDGIQSIIMLVGGVTVTIFAFIQVGGVSTAIGNLDEAGLNNFFKYVASSNIFRFK